MIYTYYKDIKNSSVAYTYFSRHCKVNTNSLINYIEIHIIRIILAMRRRIRGILMSGKQFSLDSRMDLVQVYLNQLLISQHLN